MMCCVVNDGQGTKTMKLARKHGVRGGTVCIGRGAMSSRLLEFLDLNDSRKEVVILIGEAEIIRDAMEAVSREMHFNRPNHGIAFSISLTHFLGNKHYEYNDGGETRSMSDYEAIFTIVDKGLAEDVMDAAQKGGARGGTIINARGSGLHEASVLFAMPIEPEKEMVLILSKQKNTADITSAIRKALHIDEPNKGIVFTMGVNQAIGLH
jgi:nitrogen regulatory protein PII